MLLRGGRILTNLRSNISLLGKDAHGEEYAWEGAFLSEDKRRGPAESEGKRGRGPFPF